MQRVAHCLSFRWGLEEVVSPHLLPSQAAATAGGGRDGKYGKGLLLPQQ